MDRTDEARWTQAESILVRQPTEEARRRLKRRRTQLWLFVAAITALALGVGALLVVVLSGSGALDAAEPPTWATVVGFVVSSVGIVVDVVGLVILVRRGRWGQAWRAPTAVLSRQQRRHVMDQIRGRQPRRIHRLPLARDLAERLADQRGTAVLIAGIVLINVGNTLLTPSVFRLWLTAAVLVIYAIGGVFLLRQVRLARRFLDAHPEETLDR